MKSLFAAGTLFVLAFSLSARPAESAENEGPSEGRDDPVRILFVTQSEGFRHGSVTRQDNKPAPAEDTMTELGVESGLFRITTSQDVAKDFTREVLDDHDIVMFYTTGNLPIPEDVLEYFLNDWLKQKGHGFIGVHSATDTYHEHEPFWDMIGGTFDGHPWGADETVTITVHDTTHPVTQPWGEEFEITDEIYQFRHWQPEKVHVLMSLNMAKTEKKKPYHVPVAWCKEYGDGRVVYISLGHREDVWTNPKYRQSLLGAVKWILHKAEGDATPNPDLSAQENEEAREDAEAGS
jgi:type 1 glutamine amidotransferase